jgi:hypothetical protein
MRCRDVHSKLDLFANGELTSVERQRIEMHLESCASCREALTRARRLENVLAAASCPPVPEGFASSVLERARQDQSIPVARHVFRPDDGHSACRRTDCQSVPQPGRVFRLGRRHSVWRQLRFAAATAAALSAGLLMGLIMGRDIWRADVAPAPAAARPSAELLAAAGLEQLVEPGGDSLAQAYLGLTVTAER